MPVCNKCGVEKEQDQFPKDKKSKTGYSYLCKQCNCARAKAYVESHPEWNEAYQQKQCFSYKNLQLLWAKDNLQKSDKWEAVLEA